MAVALRAADDLNAIETAVKFVNLSTESGRESPMHFVQLFRALCGIYLVGMVIMNLMCVASAIAAIVLVRNGAH